MASITIIKVGTTFPDIARRYGDFDDWVRTGLALAAWPIETVDAEQGAPLPPPAACAGIVITGSHAMVTDRQDWSVAIERWIPQLLAAKVPLLGICYGHQLLAEAAGGVVGYHAGGVEAGTVPIQLFPASAMDPLFAGMPTEFVAHAVHAQTVLALPQEAVLLAGNDFEPHHAYRLGVCAWGLQFHPEYDEKIMTAYLLAEMETCQTQGLDVGRRLAEVRPTPQAAALLKRFGQFVARSALS